MKKPKLPQDMNIDYYYAKYSENENGPDINFYNHNYLYQFHAHVSKQDIKKELKRLKRDAEAILKVHDYLQKVIKL